MYYSDKEKCDIPSLFYKNKYNASKQSSTSFLQQILKNQPKLKLLCNNYLHNMRKDQVVTLYYLSVIMNLQTTTVLTEGSC